MVERRNSPRRRVLKSVKIIFGTDSVTNCTVRDLSQTGACVEVQAPWSIPSDFTLVIESDTLKRACHTARVNANPLGVAFQ
jgi:PilZ domain